MIFTVWAKNQNHSEQIFCFLWKFLSKVWLALKTFITFTMFLSTHKHLYPFLDKIWTKILYTSHMYGQKIDQKFAEKMMKLSAKKF